MTRALITLVLAIPLGFGAASAQSPFRVAKAQALLERKLPCLGCHAIEGKGGRIGPDLTRVGSRLSREQILRKIEDPRGVLRDGIMPRIPLQEGIATLLADYLAQRTSGNEVSMPAAPRLQRGRGGGEQLYQRHCAACHGAEGDGDGFNARYLDRPPLRHGDARVMRLRTDDRLYDAIHAGGAIMGGSARMPAYGRTLTTAEIRALVAHLRELCRCRQPEWADAAR